MNVKSVHQMRWATIKNGDLLALADKQFDVFVTVDRNLSFQQNLDAFPIAVVVLHGRTASGRWRQLNIGNATPLPVSE
jgi:hypothetical protein